jgi:hypothetical protein
MQDTNITALLRTFSKREFKEFKAYVRSPAQIKKRNVRVYFKAIENFYPEFKRDSFNDEKIFRSIFPGKEFDKSKLSLAAFHLFDAACDFLVSTYNSQNSGDTSLVLLRMFMERDLKSSFLKLAGKLEKKITSSDFSLENYFLLRYKYNDILMTYHTQENNYELIIKYYSKKIECVTALFLLKSIRLFMNKYFVNSTYSFEFENDLLEDLKSKVDYDELFSEKKKSMYLDILKPIYYTYKGLFSDNCILWAGKAEDSFTNRLNLYSRDEKVQISREILNLYYRMTTESRDQQTIMNLQK